MNKEQLIRYSDVLIEFSKLNPLYTEAIKTTFLASDGFTIDETLDALEEDLERRKNESKIKRH